MPRNVITREDLRKNPESDGVLLKSNVGLIQEEEYESIKKEPTSVGISVDLGAGDGLSEREFRFVLSTESEDRMGDVIELAGWELENFFKGGPGPVLFAHNPTNPPVGVSKEIIRTPTNLIGAVRFVDKEINPLAGTIEAMVSNRIIKSSSVGFVPKQMEIIERDEGFGIRFRRQELIEFSIVPVPANPDAVLLGKDLGIDMKPLDEWARMAIDLSSGGDVIPVEVDKLKSVVKALGYGRGIKFFDLGASEIKQKVKAKVREDVVMEDRYSKALEEAEIEPEDLVKLLKEERAPKAEETENVEPPESIEKYSSDGDLTFSLGEMAELRSEFKEMFREHLRSRLEG